MLRTVRFNFHLVFFFFFLFLIFAERRLRWLHGKSFARARQETISRSISVKTFLRILQCPSVLKLHSLSLTFPLKTFPTVYAKMIMRLSLRSPSNSTRSNRPPILAFLVVEKLPRIRRLKIKRQTNEQINEWNKVKVNKKEKKIRKKEKNIRKNSFSSFE